MAEVGLGRLAGMAVQSSMRGDLRVVMRGKEMYATEVDVWTKMRRRPRVGRERDQVR